MTQGKTLRRLEEIQAETKRMTRIYRRRVRAMQAKLASDQKAWAARKPQLQASLASFNQHVDEFLKRHPEGLTALFERLAAKP